MRMNDQKHIAVFGDTHGHLRLMFQLCRQWQLTHQKKIDVVLQCGDLGYYPNPNNLDKATQRYARKDPEELGFKYFTKPVPMSSDEMLREILCGPQEDFNTVSAPVLFCHGNHEDFQSLSESVGNTEIAPVDCFDRLFWLRPGYIHDALGVRIAAIGGGTEPRDAPEDDYGLSEPWKWVNNRAVKALQTGEFNILISHTSPTGVGGESDRWGSTRLRRLVESNSPAYHFFAHHKNRIEPSCIGTTRCYWLNDVNFDRNAKSMAMPLEIGCMGILSWKDETNHDFEMVDGEWIRDVNSVNWWKK